MSLLGAALKTLFGTKQSRDMKRYAPLVDTVNEKTEWAAALSDGELRQQTDIFRQRIADGESLEDLIPEAFSVVRETGTRVLNMRHFDVQMIGGMALFEGKIAEMATGEGKTLVATLPAYVHGLTGKGVHIVTVNDYLARRDRDWMGPLFEFLGLTVGVIQHDLEPPERREAYGCDITYGTNNEFGFDYLRDNMAIAKEYCVQRPLYYGIVDEVDSILIDEARTPLIISGPADVSTDKYHHIDKAVRQLVIEDDFTVDEKDNVVVLTDEGTDKIQEILKVNIYDESNLDLVHHINTALRAHHLFRRDERYMVEDGEVIIVDEFTGRKMPGRRYSDGLHQALEAKEGLQIQRENQTLATITFQNYFRLYDVLSGMTGTADTEAQEFMEIYKLEVVVIPTNKPIQRDDMADQVYKTIREKYEAIADKIEELHTAQQPVLVGTVSIEKSEKVSKLLKKRKVPHEVLNAKFHEREAEIVTAAGQPGAVTIATNMAGRGTDIKLGEGVLESGGLFILGTERHESRRIDNQLRGRAGRQGDPGATCFYLSLEDDLMRIFGGERIKGLAERFGMAEGEVLEHGMVSKAIENAQKRVETHHFDMRKHIIKYDDVMNKQREVIYAIRQDLLHNEKPEAHFWDMCESVIDHVQTVTIGDPRDGESWELENLRNLSRQYFGIIIPPEESPDTWLGIEVGMSEEEIFEQLCSKVKEKLAERKEKFGPELAQWLMSVIMLRTVDSRWKEHLYTMDSLKESIGLRAYGQKDPQQEYSKEGYALFEEAYFNIHLQSVGNWFHVEVQDPGRAREQMKPRPQQRIQTNQGETAPSATAARSAASRKRGAAGPKKKIKPNDPCPCGSGKKYKKCCMLKEAAGMH